MINHRAQGLLARVLYGLAAEGRVDGGILRYDRKVVEAQQIIEKGAHTGFETGAGEHAVEGA